MEFWRATHSPFSVHLHRTRIFFSIVLFLLSSVLPVSHDPILQFPVFFLLFSNICFLCGIYIVVVDGLLKSGLFSVIFHSFPIYLESVPKAFFAGHAN